MAGFPDGGFDACGELARRRVATLGVRTLDALHVAAALELKADAFWTFDERQKKLAEIEGLYVRWMNCESFDGDRAIRHMGCWR